MEQYKDKLLEYLKSRDLMVLSTMGKRPTACSIYYGVDEDFKLYIVTSPSSEHGVNIADNHQIAGVIVDTNQSMYQTKNKVGVQLYGLAKEVVDKDEMIKALTTWSKNKAEVVNSYLEKINNNTYKSRPYVIELSELKWFNEELFGKNGKKVFTF